MSPVDIKLKKQAGKLREQAHVKLDKLKEALALQAAGELPEGQTRLTHEEIQTQHGEIEDLLKQAVDLEKVNDLDSIMNRPAEQLSEGAGGIKEVLEALREQPTNGNRAGQENGSAPFAGIGEFVRAVRASEGGNYAGHIVTKDQRIWLSAMGQLATIYDQGGNVQMAVRELFGVNGERAKEAIKALEAKVLVSDAPTGDFLVPTEHMAELLRIMAEQQQFANRARRIPMSRRTLDFPRLAQTTAANTRPLFGFAAITKIAEGAQKPEHEPAFEQLTLTAIKYAAYTEASDELLSDSIVALPPVLVGLLSDAIAYEFDRDTMRGSGTAEPQGFIGSAAEFAVNRTTANQINLQDIWAMESRFFGAAGIWLYSPSIIPQLFALASNNIIVWSPDVSAGAPGTLLGRALVTTHKLPVLGSKGDLNLVDPQFYLVGDLQRISIANSIHFRFRNDITAWRATFRAAGTPWPAAPFSHEATGGEFVYRVSPFVPLDVVATS